MTATAKNNVDVLKSSVRKLSRHGKYGEAVRMLNHAATDGPAHMSWDEDEFNGFISGLMCGSCCRQADDDSGGCCSKYCCCTLCVFACCGEEIGSACCCDTVTGCCSSSCC